MEPVKWGIIGPGNIAQQFADDLQHVNPPQKIEAVLGNPDSDSAATFADKFSVPRQFTDLNEFVKKSNSDVVYIATPHPLHYEQAKVCLENKLPVLCEKPLTINKEQARELINLSKKNNTFLMEGMWIRFLPILQKVLELVRAGTIGKIIAVNGSMSYKAPYDPENRYFDPDKGGGSLLDLGVYPIFLSTLLLGKPRVIKAIGKLSETGVDESCSVLLGYTSGAHAIIESSIIFETSKPAEIIGEKGVIQILPPWFEESPGIDVQIYGEQKITYHSAWIGHGLQYQVQEVLGCLANNKIESEQMPHSLSLDVVDTMDEIRNQINVSYDKYE